MRCVDELFVSTRWKYRAAAAQKSAPKAAAKPSAKVAAWVEPPEDPATFERIATALTAAGIRFSLTEHNPVKTSAEAARIRGVSLASGAKAMFLFDKKKKKYFLAVISAATAIDFKKLRKVTGKRSNLASQELTLAVTGCLTGAVPPFGSLMTGGGDGVTVQTVCDHSLVAQGDEISFNCGLRTKSVRIRVADWQRFEQPMMVDFGASAQ